MINTTLRGVTVKSLGLSRYPFRSMIENIHLKLYRRRSRRHIALQVFVVLFSFVRCPFVSVVCTCNDDCRHDHGRPQGGQNGHFLPPGNWD